MRSGGRTPGATRGFCRVAGGGVGMRGLATPLAGRGPVLLDFDGPVCGLFAGRPAPRVAARRGEVLADGGVSVPEALVSLGDPLEVLRWAADRRDPALTRTVEDA